MQLTLDPPSGGVEKLLVDGPASVYLKRTGKGEAVLIVKDRHGNLTQVEVMAKRSTLTLYASAYPEGVE